MKRNKGAEKIRMAVICAAVAFVVLMLPLASVGQCAEAAVNYGDIDGNGTVEVGDALIALKSYVGLQTLTASQTELADVDGSGEVDVTDALNILKYYVNLIDLFPVEAVPIETDSKIIVGYTLTQTGTFANTENSAYYSAYGWPLHMTNATDNTYSFIMSDGSTVDGAGGCEYLGKDLYMIWNSGDRVDSCGLLTADGTQLISYEASDIEWMYSIIDGDADEEHRYLRVTYSTGETTDEDEAFFREYDSDSSSYNYYTGYALIYDTQEQRFVSGVKVTNSYYFATYECRNSFTVEDEDGVTRLYNADGEVLLTTEKYVSVGYGYIRVYDWDDWDSDCYKIYDEKGRQRYSSNSLFVLESTGGYFLERTDDGYVVRDINGNQVLDGVYDSCYSEYYGLFEVKNNDVYMLINLDGEVLATSENNFVPIIPGYYYYKVGDDGEDTIWAVVGPNGIISEDVEDPLDLLDVDDSDQALIINEKVHSLDLSGTSSVSSIVEGMVYARTEGTSMYGVFDLFTGTQLLDYEYSSLGYCGDYLYALKDGIWTIYRITPTYAE